MPLDFSCLQSRYTQLGQGYKGVHRHMPHSDNIVAALQVALVILVAVVFVVCSAHTQDKAYAGNLLITTWDGIATVT